ncbi:MAG: xanthine dehydrogenase family protein subunit M [Gemmatimonadetes bacterium]|nr:xanthine dehydrogenase family protein subunit M [Gemmatimonadota bacterium]
MAIIRDMMPPFELYQPATVEDAIELARRYGNEGWVLAGGLDSYDWFKDRIKRPRAVIDLGAIAELREIRALEGGLEIGAMATLTDIARHADVRTRFSLLADAARHVATPQIRNLGTLGGNLCQDTRCWYYRAGWPCYRAGGNVCYASAPEAMNREHAVMGMKRCVAVNPSDTAAALIALDAQMVVRHRRGERSVDAEDFFIGPAIDITRMTVLKPGDLLTAVRVPDTWAGTRFYFEKVRDRNAWDFPLVTVASAMVVQAGRIERARIAVNGVAPYPVRLHEVERAVTGRTLNEETAAMAGELAVRRVTPLRHNDFKLPLMRNLVRRSLRGAEA